MESVQTGGGAAPSRLGPATPKRVPLISAELSLDHVLRFLLVTFQFGLLILTVRTFGIESKAFLHLLVFAFFGFIVHHFLPSRHRLGFFAALSMAGFFVVFGAANAAWIIGPGLALIALAHAPVPFPARVALVCAAGALFAFLRTRPELSPIPGGLWPIIGSMFMFRMIMYLYELRLRRVPFSPAHALAYFFMIPNVCFPMFPLVDYKTFCSSHYSDDSLDVYQTGLHWCFQGVLHILLYRFIYQNIVVDPATVANAGEAARHIASSFLVYLRFTGSFHLIIGLLHLFGFRLPRVFHYWLLASSFLDHWRRANIYWKDFIQKLVFYPAHFWLNRRVGAAAVLTIATAFTFALTWALHSYQWFWIRGHFPVLVQDMIFWGVIGTGVLVNMLLEARVVRRRSLKKEREKPADAARRALKTVAMFLFMCFAWTFWTAESFEEAWRITSALSQQTPASAAGIAALLLGVAVAAVLLGKRSVDAPVIRATRAGAGLANWQSQLRTSAATLCIALALLAVGSYPLMFSFAPKLVDIVDNIRDPKRLSARDSKALERGYYEDLTNVSRFNDELAEILSSMPPNWNVNAGVRSNPGQFPPFEFRPSVSVDYKGAKLATNEWGMHDREYTKEKAPGTFRIALLGSSHTVGIGVDRTQTYENVVEDRLNSEFAKGSKLHFEILNFAVSGYGPVCGLVSFEKRILEFQPDALLVGGMDDITWVVNELVNASAKKLPLPYAPLTEMIARAGVPPGSPQAVAEQRLSPHAREMLGWTYARYIEVAREHGVIPLATVLPRPEVLTDRVAELDAEQTAMMREAGFHVIDTQDAYAGAKDPAVLWIRKYDRHPDAVGHRMLADALYQSLTKELTTLGVGAGERD